MRFLWSGPDGRWGKPPKTLIYHIFRLLSQPENNNHLNKAPQVQQQQQPLSASTKEEVDINIYVCVCKFVYESSQGVG